MKKNSILTKTLAIAGTVLLLLPLLAALVFGVVSLVGDGIFRFDFMMPAELFGLVLLGGALLFWASIRAHACRRLIGISLGAAVLLLVVGQVIAVASGLADASAAQPELWNPIVIGTILLYDLGVLVAGIGGVLLTRRLFSNTAGK